jgi:hypothetical protein
MGVRRETMSTLEKIAFFQNRRDEVPNQLLAKELAEKEDNDGIHEIANNLDNKDKNISSDCLKVLYEIGYLKPNLIAPYVDNFLSLLSHKDNRKVWGAMIALGTIAPISHKEIGSQIDTVIDVVNKGSVITVLWGVRVLAGTLAKETSLEDIILPEILHILQICVPRDVPTHLESILPMITATNRKKILAAVESRRSSMTAAHLTRLKKVLKSIQRI